MKKFIKSIIFLLIFGFLFKCTFNILWLDETPVATFYDEPKNTIDIVYLGSSNAYAHFNTVLAYNEYGFTTGLVANDSQPFPFIKYLIIESRKYQNPELYIIDIATLQKNFSEYEEAEIRKTADSMKFSKNRIAAINETLGYIDIDKSEYVNYYFSFLKYHNMWKDITSDNFKKPDYLYKGFLFSNVTSEINPQNSYIWPSDEEMLPYESEQALLDLISYIKDNNLNVLFIIPKRIFGTQSLYRRFNSVISIIEENDLKLINFNTLEDFDINFNTDLYNYAHLNIYGSTKYTLYFSKYLKENYNLKDHRGDKKYNSWNEEYNRFKASYQTIMKKDFDELLLEYNLD